MVSEEEVKHIAELADIGISADDLEEFTHQFNKILEYFDILDRVSGEGERPPVTCNVVREDGVVPSLSQEDAIQTAGGKEDGYIKAPRVM